MKKSFVLFVLILLGACSSNVRRESGAAEKKLWVDGKYHYLYLPSDYDPAKKYPLLFCVYYSDSYRGFVAPYADSRQVIILSTDEWSSKLYDTLTNRYSIDPDRVYVTGWSAGGALTFVLSQACPDLFAAVNPMYQGISRRYFEKNGGYYFYNQQSFMDNVTGLAVRHTPELLYYNNGVYFHYLANAYRSLGIGEIFEDYTNAVDHSPEGMKQDFSSQLDFLLAHTRNRYPERIAWSSPYEKESLYYLRDIRYDTNKIVYYLSAVKTNGGLKIETYGVVSMRIARSDYEELRCTSPVILVNGKPVDTAARLTNGMIDIPVEDPDYIDGLRRSAETDGGVTVLSLESRLAIHSDGFVTGTHVYRVKLANSARPFVLTVNRMQIVSNVTIGGAGARFERLWDVSTPDRYYRIYPPAGTPASAGMAMKIDTYGLLPQSGVGTSLFDLLMLDSLYQLVMFRTGDAVPLPVKLSGQFRYKLTCDLITEDPRSLYILSSSWKRPALWLGAPAVSTELTNGRVRYETSAEVGAGKQFPMAVYLDPGRGFSFTNSGVAVDYFDSMYPNSTGLLIESTNAAFKAAGTLAEVLGPVARLSLIGNSDCQFSFEWDTVGNPSASDVLGSVTGQPLGSPVMRAFVYSVAKGDPILVDPAAGRKYPLLSDKGVHSVAVVENMIPGFIDTPCSNAEQASFRWALRRYLSWAVLEKQAVVDPCEYAAYTFYLDRRILNRRGEMPAVSAVSGYKQAYIYALVGELLFFYAEGAAGRDGVFSIITRHRAELLASAHPYALLRGYVKQAAGNPFDTQALETAALKGCPAIGAAASLSTNGDKFRVHLTVTAASNVPFPVEIAFYTNGVKAVSVWKELKSGGNVFDEDLPFAPGGVYVNPTLAMFEPSASDNYAAFAGSADYAKYLKAFTDYERGAAGTTIHGISSGQVKTDVKKSYEAAETGGGPVEIVYVMKKTEKVTAVLIRVGGDFYFLFFKTQSDGTERMVDAAYV